MNIGTMWILNIILLTMFGIAGAMLFYKDGLYIKKKKRYLVIVLFSLVLSILAYFVVPDYLFIDKIIVCISAIAAIASFILKDKMVFISKLILMTVMSINIVIALI
ncbi:MAG: hypothetical protein ACRC57_03070 [Sarcina sp.]